MKKQILILNTLAQLTTGAIRGRWKIHGGKWLMEFLKRLAKYETINAKVLWAYFLPWENLKKNQ